eukprot:450911_1
MAEAKHDMNSNETCYQNMKRSVNAGCFGAYTAWNALRYLAIGVFIYMANLNTAKDRDSKFCCPCYYQAANDTSHRYDLSYCIPACTTCNYCESYFNNSSPGNNTCPVQGYVSTNHVIDFDWSRKTGCGDNINISTLYIFLTSYKSMRIIAIILTSHYSVILMVLCSLCSKKKHQYKLKIIESKLLKVIAFYNIMFTTNCLYLLFTTDQFKESTYDKCYVSDVTKVWQTYINSIIFIGIFIAVCHYIMMIIYACKVCCRLYQIKRMDPILIHIRTPSNTSLASNLNSGSESSYETFRTTIPYPITAECMINFLLKVFGASSLLASCYMFYFVFIGQFNSGYIVFALIFISTLDILFFILFQACCQCQGYVQMGNYRMDGKKASINSMNSIKSINSKNSIKSINSVNPHQSIVTSQTEVSTAPRLM